MFVLDREDVPHTGYDRILDLEWPEEPTCHAGWPSTKAERCLLEVFRLQPLPQLCTYKITPSERALARARRYLEDVCGVAPDQRGRYPVVLLHYEGNTAARDKDLPVALAGDLCRQVLDAGAVPVILDWDNRTPLADGKRIHHAHVALELWGGTGTGDAEALAALPDGAWGVRSINEVRAERGLPPVEWGDKPWLPVTLAPTDFPDREALAPHTGRASAAAE